MFIALTITKHIPLVLFLIFVHGLKMLWRYIMKLTLMLFFFFISAFNSKNFGAQVALQFLNCTVPVIMMSSKTCRYITVQIISKNH